MKSHIISKIEERKPDTMHRQQPSKTEVAYILLILSTSYI